MEDLEGPQQIHGFLQRHPDMTRVKINISDFFPLSTPELERLVTPEGDLRTLPSDLPNEQARLAGLDGFYAASLTRRP